MIDIKLILAVFKGTLTFLPGFANILDKKKLKSIHSCSNALFCFTLWFRVLNYLKKNKLPIKFQSLGEIGSGGSLGIAFCALLTGSGKYYSLEIEHNFSIEKNLLLFEEILQLFITDKRVPDIDKYDRINIHFQEYRHYSEIIDQEELKKYLSFTKIEQIRTSIKTMNSKNLCVIYDWENNISESDKVDFIFSRAVMEHVNDPFSIYASCYKLLNNNGFALHDIEFHSHDITEQWNRHYSINNFLWKIIRGRRKYYLNRYNYYDHIQFIEMNNYIIIDKSIISKAVSGGDNEIYGAAILAKKPG